MTTTTGEGATATTTGEGAATTTTTTQAAAANGAGDSLLNAAAAAGEQGGEGATTTTAADGADTDWLPEKFRVNDAEGKLDQAASARKLAESYKALEAHKGPLPQAPATPEDYKLEAPKDAEGKPVEGIDFDAFVADPLFKGFAKDAHAAGLSNEQMQFVVAKYLDLAPQLLQADTGLSADEAKAALLKLWPDDATLSQNLSGAVRAIRGFGGEADDMPGSRKSLMEKFGSDPDFIAFASRIAGEMKEDQLPASGTSTTGEHDIQALQASEAYWKPEHPDHGKVKAQVDAYYRSKHGTAPRRGSVVSVPAAR